MPVSKKRHKSKKLARQNRLRNLRTGYSTFDTLLASPDKPMPKEVLDNYLLRLYEAVAELDGGVSKTSWNFLADITNPFQTLILEGVCEDEDNQVIRALNALTEAALVWHKTEQITFTPEQADHVRAIAEDFSLIARQLTHRQMLECHRLTQIRIEQEIKNPENNIIRIS